MALTLTGDIAKQLFKGTKKDDKLATVLASEFLNIIDSAAMADYLLEPRIAMKLLADRFLKDPEQTIRDLEKLPHATRKRRSRLPKQKAKPAKAGKKVVRKARRHRLTAEQVTSLKSQVQSFLKAHPWATRRELTKVVDLPTQAIYRRIMMELQQANVIVSKGEKSKTVYAVKGAARQAKAKKAKKAPRKAARKVAKKAPRKVAKKTARKAAPKNK